MSRGAEVACDGRSVTVQVPLALRRQGGRKQVVSPAGWSGPALAPRPARLDGALVKALARAHRWRGMLEGGEYGSIEELARAEKINPSYLAACCGSPCSRRTSWRASSMGGMIRNGPPWSG